MAAPDSTPADSIRTLMRIAPALARLQNEVLGALDTRMTYRQYRLLVLVDRGHDYPTALQSATALSLGTISASVDTLVGRGLLGRTPHGEDRRRIILHVTDAGQAAIAQGRDAMADLADVLAAAYADASGEPVHKRLQAVLLRTQAQLAEA